MQSEYEITQEIRRLEELLGEMESREHCDFSVSKVSVKVAIDTLRWVVDDESRHYGEGGESPADSQTPFEEFGVVVTDESPFTVDVEEKYVGHEVPVVAGTPHEAKKLALEELGDGVPYSYLEAEVR